MTSAAPKPAAFAAGDVVGGRYRLVTILGQGGMGTVWRAIHLELGVNVAVKLIPPSLISSPVALTRFQREARAAATIRSPHVVTIHDYGTDDGRPYLVMELLPGEDLRSRLDRVGRLGLEEASVILTGICKALRLAHDAGIVHRDLKPGNIFLARADDDEVVKVLDFGVAKDLNAATDTVRTASDALVGSPRYMSPEQVRGGAIDHRSDLWSASVVLYEMVTGRHPFSGDTVGDVLLKIAMDEIPAPSSLVPTLTPALDAFFRWALARKAEARFPDAMTLAMEFRAVALDPGAPADSAAKVGRNDATADLTPRVEMPEPVPPAVRREGPTSGAVASATPAVAADSTESALTKRMAPARSGRGWMIPTVVGAAVLGTVATLALVPRLDRAPREPTALAPSDPTSDGTVADVVPLAPAATSSPSEAAAPPPSASPTVAPPAASSGPLVAPRVAPTTGPKTGPAPRAGQGPVREPPPPGAAPKPSVDPMFGVSDTP